MVDMLWIEDIVESTLTSPFLTNFRVDMVGFMDIRKVVVKRNAFLAFPSTQNGGELEGEAESGRLKRQFSQVEGELDLQEIPKLVAIPKKIPPRKKIIVMKDKDEKGEKVGIFLVDGCSNNPMSQKSCQTTKKNSQNLIYIYVFPFKAMAIMLSY
jgi:hypothetical protein